MNGRGPNEVERNFRFILIPVVYAWLAAAVMMVVYVMDAEERRDALGSP